MNRRITILLFPVLLALSAGAQTKEPVHAEGILAGMENAHVTAQGEGRKITRSDAALPVKVVFTGCQALGLSYEERQWWVLPLTGKRTQGGASVTVNRGLWVLPLDAHSEDHAWYLRMDDGEMVADQAGSNVTVTVRASSFTLTPYEARPHSDAFGSRFSLQIAGGTELGDALAGFYWGTILPSVVEKTMAANFRYSSGYVLSTLNVSSYAGSYPAVDHEFQIKGRLAAGSQLDLDVVKRMIALQFRLMEDDPERLSRAPTSVQPDGRREYHVRRSSQDNRENAAMFPLTGNIEVVEEAWHYYEALKDVAWLRANIGKLEEAAAWILANTDQYGRVWSDVYYEDQVMKDGRETEAQAFAAHAFELLAGMEAKLGRAERAARFTSAAKKMASALVAPLPLGYWDVQNARFIDWVDRNGKVHDHVHLLANELPVTFGYATAEQADGVRRLIAANDLEFERFPSFLAAKIGDYTRSEIGDGGPYDLCAAGRYWYWDAAFRSLEQETGVVLKQLQTVAAEGAKNNYLMSERYDMDHVYYVDGKPAHGAEKYYEYPNVFTAVLMEKYLGLTVPANADVAVTPRVQAGSVEVETAKYAVRYSVSKDGFSLKNLANKPRTFAVDLSGAGLNADRSLLQSRARRGPVSARVVVVLGAHEEAHWSVPR